MYKYLSVNNACSDDTIYLIDQSEALFKKDWEFIYNVDTKRFAIKPVSHSNCQNNMLSTLPICMYQLVLLSNIDNKTVLVEWNIKPNTDYTLFTLKVNKSGLYCQDYLKGDDNLFQQQTIELSRYLSYWKIPNVPPQIQYELYNISYDIEEAYILNITESLKYILEPDEKAIDFALPNNAEETWNISNYTINILPFKRMFATGEGLYPVHS